MAKNCFDLWVNFISGKSEKVATFPFDSFDSETIEVAEYNLSKAIEKAFTDNTIKEVHIMKYNDVGDVDVTTRSNPNRYKPTTQIIDAKSSFIFSSLKDNLFTNIAVFDDEKVARAKIIDYLLYNHGEYEQDEIELIADQLITSKVFDILDAKYYFTNYVTNKC